MVRVMSLTPTYDQLRSERINAGAPTSEADPQLNHPGQHRLRDDALRAAAVGDSSRGPETDLVEGWFWLGTTKPPPATSPHPTGSAPASAGTPLGTPRREQTPAAEQQARHALVPPPVHARDGKHGTVGASRDTKADPPSVSPHVLVRDIYGHEVSGD